MALECDPWVDADRGETRVDQGARALAPRVEGPVRAGRIVRRRPGRVEVERLPRDLHAPEVGLRGAHHEGEVELEAAHAIEEDVARVDGEAELHAGEPLAEVAHDAGEHVEARGVDHPHAQRPALAPRSLAELVPEVLYLRRHAIREGEHLLALSGEAPSPALALDEGDADAALQARERAREGRLAHTEPRGGRRDAARASNLPQVGEVAQAYVEERPGVRVRAVDHARPFRSALR